MRGGRVGGGLHRGGGGSKEMVRWGWWYGNPSVSSDANGRRREGGGGVERVVVDLQITPRREGRLPRRNLLPVFDPEKFTQCFGFERDLSCAEEPKRLATVL